MSIFDTTLESFKQDVLEASAERPILVDFWAEKITLILLTPTDSMQPAQESVP